MATVFSLSSYSLATIALTVASGSATPTYIWQAAIPSGAKGKAGILQLFFNLYAATDFFAGQSFNYGIYVDGVPLSLGDSTTINYVHTAATPYAISSGGVVRGTNGFVGYSPLIIPVSFSSGASVIQIGISNSSLAMSAVSSASPQVMSNVTVASGLSNTSNFIPINTFTSQGTYNYTVPTTVQGGSVVGVYVYLWGAGGGPSASPSAGGGGGFTSGFYSCAGGTTLTYIVGATGGNGSFSNGCGQPNTQSGAEVGPSGPSGGFSGIFSTATASVGTVIGIAGGGGSGCAQMNGGNGGAGGGSNAGAGWNYMAGVYQSGGGTQTAGGSNHSDGQVGQRWIGGGNGWGTATKGGGGWWGGGSGGPGGGGGSGYTSNFTSGGQTQTGTTLLGSTSTPALALPAGTTSPYFLSGYANGSGTGGFVVIVPAIGSGANQVGVQANLFVV
jgi:hypothetical protein